MDKFPENREFRIVGSASEENKKHFQEDLRRRLYSRAEYLDEEIKSSEILKSPEQIEIINTVNDILSEYVAQFNIEYYPLPVDNYHIIKTEVYKQKVGANSLASFSNKDLVVFVQEKLARQSDLFFAALVLHETLHYAAYIAYGAVDNPDNPNQYKIGMYRAGTASSSYYGKTGHAHFEGLGEAIVTELQKEVFAILVDHPKMKEIRDIYDDPKYDDKKGGVTSPGEWKSEELISENGEHFDIPYGKNREVLDYICSEIFEENQDVFADKRAVLREFFSAHFSGRLLAIAHLVEGAFGKGSFRILGNMKEDSESGQLHLEQFRKSRLNFKKTK